MLKILGAIEMLTGVFLFLFLKFDIFEWLLIFFLVLLIIKSLLTWKDLFSIVDILSSFIIFLSFFGFVSGLTWLVLGWLFFKGLWSLVSSV